MNIRDVVTALAAETEKLPAGWDTDVRVSMCNGEGVENTTVIEVDHMSSISLETLDVNEVYAIVQGHPHDDEQAQWLPGIATGADAALQRWTDKTDGGSDAAG